MDKSKGRKTKSKGKGKRRQTTGTVVGTKERELRDREREHDKEKERDTRGATTTLPRLDRDTIEKVPSNAPTMAIAPSDYEHIFHEGPAGGNNNERMAVAAPQPSPPQQAPSPTGMRPGAGPHIQLSPSPPRPRTPEPQPQDYMYAPLLPQQQTPQLGPQPVFGRQQYAAEVQVTPDGYTMLGHTPDTSAQRRVALPAHIVRASNQFSRAALAKVAKFLASRADPPR